MNIVLFGPPGAGKGTQAQKLAVDLGCSILSPGEMIRAEISKGTDLGKELSPIIQEGRLPSDEIIFKMVGDKITKDPSDYVFDGFPRTVPQGIELEKILSKNGRSIDLIVCLRVTNEVVKKRILGRYMCQTCGALYNKYFTPPREVGICDKCGGTSFSMRTDDTEEIIETRLKVYKDQTEPVINYFKKGHQIVEIDADQDPEEVFKEIKRNLNKLDKSKKVS